MTEPERFEWTHVRGTMRMRHTPCGFECHVDETNLHECPRRAE